MWPIMFTEMLISEQIFAQEQKNNFPRLPKHLKQSSQKGSGAASPNFIFSSKLYPYFLIVIEFKAIWILDHFRLVIQKGASTFLSPPPFGPVCGKRFGHNSRSASLRAKHSNSISCPRLVRVSRWYSSRLLSISHSSVNVVWKSVKTATL